MNFPEHGGGKRFHTEVTEFKHREHGDVSGNFAVRSVIPWRDDSNGNRLRELCVKRFGICSSHGHFVNKSGWKPGKNTELLSAR